MHCPDDHAGSAIPRQRPLISFEDVQPGFSVANCDSTFEDGTSGVSVAKTARLFVVVDGVHWGPMFMASTQIAGRDSRGGNKGNFGLGPSFLVFNVQQATTQAFLDQLVASDLKKKFLIISNCVQNFHFRKNKIKILNLNISLKAIYSTLQFLYF